MEYYRGEVEIGDHVTLVGRTKSGKTTLARQLLVAYPYVVVLATKRKDPSLYSPLMEKGYRIIDDIGQLNFAEHPRYIFRPLLDLDAHGNTRSALDSQSDQFRELLLYSFDVGGICLYCDEVRYLTDNLGLSTEMETLWLQGRSLEVTMMAATQRPVSVPILAFTEPRHLFLFKNGEYNNVKRMSEFAGVNSDVARVTIPRLPPHEALYLDLHTDFACRTKVDL